MSGETHVLWRFKVKVKNRWQTASLYYYAGNFFYPLFLPMDLESRARHFILKFIKANREVIRSDRSHSNYQTKLQLSGTADL